MVTYHASKWFTESNGYGYICMVTHKLKKLKIKLYRYDNI